MRRLLSLLAICVSPLFLYADNVIIRCQRPCTAAKSAVLNAGGSVTIEYKYVDAIAATVPGADKLKQLPAGSVTKDLIVAQPRVARDRNGAPMLASAEVDAAAQALDSATLAQIAAVQPNGYLINNASLDLGPLFAAGKTGAGIRVAVIDSGIRPGFPHISLDGSVIGGEDFVGDALGWINSGNDGHGTFVAGMISANVLFSGGIVSFVQPVCPACIFRIGTTSFLPMVGSAPDSSIYALRVFGATGGAPESRIIAAMERVIELRDNYDRTGVETKVGDKYNSLNVKVCNMSLGGATLFAGRDVEDQLTKVFLDHDIVLVTSAGNAGPSGTTVGGPGTGFGTITVGASSDAIHERILRKLQGFPNNGKSYRPFDGTQMAYFSSRGPDADGRTDPDVVANGFASFGQGLSGGATTLNFASGTSFSSPTTAGVAAVLRQAAPAATARQVRNAIIMSANPNVLADGSGVNDQGSGYVDANAAYQLLQSGGAPNTNGVESNPKKKVEQNIPYLEGNVTRTATLKPGQRSEIYYRLKADTQNVIVTVSKVQPGATQNPIFLDDVILSVHSAKTSAIDEGDYKVFAFTTGGTFVVENAESGLMRVTLSGDWTNASPITATVTLSTISDNIPGKHTAKDKIIEGDLIPATFTVPAGTKQLTARLEWSDDWSSYPTDDLDLYLVTPAGAVNIDGATLNSPETVSIDNPAAGSWTAYVAGFTIWGNDEKYNLIVSADGKVIKGK